MSNAPRVSIVVAAYNVAPYLSRCLASLRAQTEKSLEVIVVDDGSTDETPTIVDAHAEEDQRVRVIHCANRGLSAARNIGLRTARGTYIGFVDGDDWVESEMAESLASRCDATGASVAIAGAWIDVHDSRDDLVRSHRRVLRWREIRRDSVPEEKDVCDDEFINLMGYAWNKLYRRGWLRETGFEFEEGLSLVEDIDFNARVLAAADSIVIVPDAFVHYIQRPRLSEGAVRDVSFLSKRLRAIESVDALLDAWGISAARRSGRAARAAGTTLWMTIRAAAESSNSAQVLKAMTAGPESSRLLALAEAGPTLEWRSLWARITLVHHWHGVALAPLYASRALGSAKRRIQQRSVPVAMKKGSR